MSTSTPTAPFSSRPQRTRRTSVTKRDRVCLDSTGSGITQPCKRLSFADSIDHVDGREDGRGGGLSRPRQPSADSVLDADPTDQANAQHDEALDESLNNCSLPLDASYRDLPWPVDHQFPPEPIDCTEAFNQTGSNGTVVLSTGQVATVADMLEHLFNYACGIHFEPLYTGQLFL